MNTTESVTTDVAGGYSTAYLLTDGTTWRVRSVVRFWSGNYFGTTHYTGADESEARAAYAYASRP